ncbi:MAG: acylphosphatase, partial [Actinomycetes bacterium]
QLQLSALPAAAPYRAAGVTGGDVRVVALVSGHVQGVGYRWFVRGQAEAAGVAGSAANLQDGTVEAVLEGPADAVRRVVAALGGPRAPGAVERVETRQEPVQGVRGFTTL